MAPRKPDSKQEPYKCDKCGAMVFTIAKLHGPVCPLYRSTPAMVSSSVRYYEVWKQDEAKRAAMPVEKPKRRRKKIEKDSGI